MNEAADISDIDVDELWLREWVEEGLSSLEGYLSRRAAFEEFLRSRDGE